MLNFRKLKQDFSPAHLKEGKRLYEEQAIKEANIFELTPHQVRLKASVLSCYEHLYSCEVEVDLDDSTIIDSECNCPEHCDCHHLAAFLFYLERHYDELVVRFSQEHDIRSIDEEEKASLLATIRVSENKEEQRRDERFQKELLEDYAKASITLATSAFFLPEQEPPRDGAELVLLFQLPSSSGVALGKGDVELQLALRPPYRTKLLLISHLEAFLEAIRHQEPIYIGNRRFCFGLNHFDEVHATLLRFLMDFAMPLIAERSDKNLRYATMSLERFGSLLASLYDLTVPHERHHFAGRDGEGFSIPLSCLLQQGQEEPLKLSAGKAQFNFALEYMQSPAEALLVTPSLQLGSDELIGLDQLQWLTSPTPGIIYQNSYWRFEPQIKCKHLRQIDLLRDLVVPKPLFGTFIENSLPELMRHGQVTHLESIQSFVTLPYATPLQGECEITYLDGELEARLFFLYNDKKISTTPSQLTLEQIDSFILGAEGILARNLVEEQKIIDDLFQGFIYDPHQGAYIAKSEKKIVEFMTEVIPRYQQQVTFQCPDNLLEKFIYDDTHFALTLKEAPQIDSFEVQLKVHGHLEGASLDQLWDCITAKRAYLPLQRTPTTVAAGGARGKTKSHKILILNLEQISPLVQLFDEIGLHQLTSHKELRPLWSLATLDSSLFRGLPIKFSMSKQLKELQEQMRGERPTETSPVPPIIQAKLREYQIEGVQWLEKLRTMYLNGILADDMGLGKTLQAIIAITQLKEHHPHALSLVVAPTSLLYNWQEEIAKFNQQLKTLIIEGNPQQRRKSLSQASAYDVLITSYSLLQKDIEEYQPLCFHYVILDEAQQIKNRTTRNAKSVKMLKAQHRLILTGTPLENSLDELWSLFDFLMPGLLSTYDRFIEKYVRPQKQGEQANLDTLRRKVAPFILRRMKKDVLSELPPITEIVYHCHLSETQRDLYSSYAASAREELAQLVKKEGFDRVQIHVLATLTRLKQICCHPAIFAKEKCETGDSAKYELLMELLATLIEGGHKTVIFSQYTRMLAIMREDLQRRGIGFEYLDGSSKNRLAIVKRFNEDAQIPIFLVSLKAGGVGLNLTGADTIIHYDMWYNPAVENQATDRVHRMGQLQNVTSIKLITLNTIEEKILSLHKRKKSLVQKIVNCDDEAMAKLTWEEVLELLQI